MKLEAQQIAIAEACDDCCQRCQLYLGPTKQNPNLHPVDWCNCEPPLYKNYLYDLNAMHEAEKTLGDLNNYAETLAEICGITFGPDGEIEAYDGGFIWIHATAAQRAEAFLKTLGKWIED